MKQLRNVPLVPQALAELIGVCLGAVMSMSLTRSAQISLTLFLFAAGDGIGGCSAPGDALLIDLDGEAEITIEGVVRPLTKTRLS